MAAKKFALTLMVVGALVLGLTGCGSDDPAAPTDTAPPAVPYNVDRDYEMGSRFVDLNWDDNVVDADYAGVLIRRSNRGAAAEQITPTIVTGTSYRDENVGRGENVYYILAVDVNGNQSAAATITVVRPISHRTEHLHD